MYAETFVFDGTILGCSIEEILRNVNALRVDQSTMDSITLHPIMLSNMSR
jgi:hypothetical protein